MFYGISCKRFDWEFIFLCLFYMLYGQSITATLQALLRKEFVSRVCPKLEGKETIGTTSPPPSTMLSRLTNAFSILNLDAEDDRVETEAVTGTTVSIADSVSKGKHDPGSGKGKKKGRKVETEVVVVEKSVPKTDSSSSSEDLKLPLVWIDLEMTGLDLEVDRILEIACIITDGRLNKMLEGPNLVINQPKSCLDKMGVWCQEHHAASGLTNRVLQSKVTEKEAEKQVIDFVKEHVGSFTPLLAGNSVYMDYVFLKKYMPDLASLFNHVLVDVSSVKALCVRWFPRESKKAPQKKKTHRALDDIRESIEELKYLKENIFKPSKKS